MLGTYVVANLVEMSALHVNKSSAFDAFKVVMPVTVIMYIGVLINKPAAVTGFKTADNTGLKKISYLPVNCAFSRAAAAYGIGYLSRREMMLTVFLKKINYGFFLLGIVFPFHFTHPLMKSRIILTLLVYHPKSKCQ